MTRFDESRLQLALQHEQALRRFAVALLRDPADADDATQHALIQEARGLRSASAGVWPFLCSVLRHYAANLHKRRGRRRRHEAAAASGAVDPGADELLQREQLRRRVADAVLALDEPYRSTVWLRWFEGLDAAAVAAHQGVPVATVRTRLQRAHGQLRRRLDAERGPWSLLLALPFRRSGPSLFAGSLLMSKKFAVVAVVLVIAGLVPLALPPAATGPATRDQEAPRPVSAPLADAAPVPLQRREADTGAADADVPPAVTAPHRVQLVHADGSPAVDLEVCWWTATGRPSWTRPVDPATVRPEWPLGIGPSDVRQPWPSHAARSDQHGMVVTDDAQAVALTVRLGDGLFFSTDCPAARSIVELPPMAPVDVTVSGAPPGASWRGGCFAAWRESDGACNHGHSRVNVTTASGPGVVRWDRVPFRSDGALATKLMLPAGQTCAVEIEGIGFGIEPPAFEVTVPGAVAFVAGENVPQIRVQVVEADGTQCPRSGLVWLVAASGSQQETLVDGRASLDRPVAEPARVCCLFDDGAWSTTSLPASAETGDVQVQLHRDEAQPPRRVTFAGGMGMPSEVWLSNREQLLWAARAAQQPLLDGAVWTVGDGDLVVANLPAAVDGGFVLMADGRLARFARPEPDRAANAEWLPSAALATIDLPALSHDTGSQPYWSARLELECPLAGGSAWLPLRRFRRVPLDDHPDPLVPWTDVRVPQGWRARLTIRGGLTAAAQQLLLERLLP